MTALLTAPRNFGPIPSRSPSPKLWTVKEFHHLGELGLFEGKRASLIDGSIIEEGQMNPPHAIAGTKTEYILIRSIPFDQWHVRSQKPLVFGKKTDPEPDIAVVAGSPVDYISQHPTTAALVVEISDSSLHYDTTEKMSLYASAGIADYWVVDVNDRQLIVHRNPVRDSSASFEYIYSDIKSLKSNESIAPFFFPNAILMVSDMLP